VSVMGKADNVTPLSRYRKVERSPILKELYDHWEGLRGSRIAPKRSEIDPRRIENVLERAFILECPDQGEVRFRIAGMALGDLMGMEVRGMPAHAIIRPEGRADFNAVIARLCATPEIADVTLSGPAGIQADMLLLPMMGQDLRVSRVLGCLVARSGPVCPPVRFTVAQVMWTRIVAQDYVQTPAPQRGFAEPVQIWRPERPSGTPERPALRLVPGGRMD
jgi:hypothetical protein